MTFDGRLKELEAKILATYEQGVTIAEADNLAAEFLHAQMAVSAELRRSDLDARMRKSGLKAVRSAVYLESCRGLERKPTEGQLEAAINTSAEVITEQEAFDSAEAQVSELTRIYDIFKNAHIYYRGIAKGRFD